MVQGLDSETSGDGETGKGFSACVLLHLVAKLCPTLCDPMDCSPPGFSLHRDSPGQNAGVGMPSSRGSSQPRD